MEATSGVQFFSTWSTPTPYPIDIGPDPTPFMIGFQGNVCLRLNDPDITNGPNTTYRVEVTYIINNAFFAVFDNLSIGPSVIPLPVDFIGLVAKRDLVNNTVDLKWDVSAEVNVTEYQIEKSQTGLSFSTIGNVTLKGKSIYSFTHYNVTSGTIFYRIKSVDFDGRSKYSGIIKISGNSANSYANRLAIYPVPAKNEVTVEHWKLSLNAKMIITSVDGKILKLVILAVGSSHTPVNISDMPTGIYFLRIEDGAHEVQTVKLIRN